MLELKKSMNNSEMQRAKMRYEAVSFKHNAVVMHNIHHFIIQISNACIFLLVVRLNYFSVSI